MESKKSSGEKRAKLYIDMGASNMAMEGTMEWCQETKSKIVKAMREKKDDLFTIVWSNSMQEEGVFEEMVIHLPEIKFINIKMVMNSGK